MKNIKFHILIIFLTFPVFAKDIYFTRSGTISFFSSAPLEDIEAVNKQVTCVLDMVTGEVPFRVPSSSITFKNGLIQEHCTANHMESEKYPHAYIKDNTQTWHVIKISDKPQQITRTATIDIQGLLHNIKTSLKI